MIKMCHVDQSGHRRSSLTTCDVASRPESGAAARRCRPSPRWLSTTASARPQSRECCASSRARAWCVSCPGGGHSGRKRAPGRLSFTGGEHAGDRLGGGWHIGGKGYPVGPRPPEPLRVRQDVFAEHRRCWVADGERGPPPFSDYERHVVAARPEFGGEPFQGCDI